MIDNRGEIMAGQPSPEEIKQKDKEIRERAIADFPFERIETTGDQALSTWEQLKENDTLYQLYLAEINNSPI
jgi:hypothetical protein